MRARKRAFAYFLRPQLLKAPLEELLTTVWEMLLYIEKILNEDVAFSWNNVRLSSDFLHFIEFHKVLKIFLKTGVCWSNSEGGFLFRSSEYVDISYATLL